MTRYAGIAALLCFAALANAQPATAPAVIHVSATAEMASAAMKFWEALTPAQRQIVSFEFTTTGDGGERKNWFYTPVPRKGLPWKDMTPEQRDLGHTLVKSGLSQHGYEHAEAIQQHEAILKGVEGANSVRDPDNYYVSIFGKPGVDPMWGWRLEGHHLSLNFTIVGDQAVGAPTFMGSNPAMVQDGPHKGLRILAEEEDMGRALVKSLSDEQRKVAVIAQQAPRDIVTSNLRKIDPIKPAGVEAEHLSDAQKKMLMDLIGLYARRLRPELADQDLKEINEAGVDHIHFAWAGGLETGMPHYYRIQGPTFIIEYDNTQNNANHIHSVWRDLKNDFGEDLLKEHYEHDHDHDRDHPSTTQPAH